MIITPSVKSFRNHLRLSHRASAVLPSTGLPDPIRARTIHGVLATSPARCSLIIDVVFKSVAWLF
jgi:hypothetical protein